MKLSDVKQALTQLSAVNFKLPDGTYVPQHFHVTEVGLVTKHFIDCGGIERKETVVNFQLWEAGDYDHRLAPQKFLRILDISKKVIGEADGIQRQADRDAGRRSLSLREPGGLPPGAHKFGKK